MKDVVVRALKTFIQAAISYVCTISFIDIDWSDNTVVGGVILAALAAGISALMNIDWDAISLEKTVEDVDDETEEDVDAADADTLDEDEKYANSEEADTADEDESVEDETTESAAAGADAEDTDNTDVEDAEDDTSDEVTVDADTTETETEKACG